MKGNQVKHNRHRCNKCSRSFKNENALTQPIGDKHPTAHPWGTQAGQHKKTQARKIINAMSVN